MIGRIISHYTILEKLGEGGMGVVYKAEDTRLQRTVALKFLAPHAMRGAADTTRFLHEARAAAALNHPNICTVYEIDEADGHTFIAMEFVDGESLRERIARGPLPLADAMNYAVQIAEGCAKAHASGMVHRDIKPANIMVTHDGTVKILDFGLAKLTGQTRLTQTGTTVGTAAYLSPEQARGEEVDRRADIWSLGVVLYEMIAGRRPFAGEHQQALIYSILNEKEQPLTGLRTGVPMELERLVGRCLEKDAGLRYQTTEDLASDIRRLQRQSGEGSRAIASVLGRRNPFRRRSWAAAAVVLIVLALVYLPRVAFRDGGQSSGGRTMLVVLPFENLGESEDEYFADGITEEITSRLAVLNDLGVISRTSALHFKHSDKTVHEIGEALNVDYVLEGTVRWEKEPDGESRVRVTPRLIRVADDSQVWSEHYDEGLERIFAVQSHIASQVAGKLDITLTGSERRLFDAQPTENVIAYQFYLRGLDHIVFGHSPEAAYRQAQQLFEQAIAIDPAFALAYAKLSNAHRSLYFFGYERTEKRLQMAKQTIDRALELDPDRPEVQRELGYYYYQGLFDYEKALDVFTRLATMLPNDARLLEDISFIWRRQGRLQDAVANELSAFELNPTDAALCVEIANTYAGMRMHDEGLAYCNRAIEMAPENSWGYFLKAILLFNKSGDPGVAIEVLDQWPDKSIGAMLWAYYHFSVLERDFDAALEWLARVHEPSIRMQSGYLPVSMLEGLVYWYRGDSLRAVASFETARDLLEAAVRDNPEDARVYSSLGLTLAGLGDAEAAVAAGRKAVELYPVSKDIMLGVDRVVNLAQIYAMVGDTGSCIGLIDQVLSLADVYTFQYFDLHPCFDAVRRDPRYEEIRRKYGSGR
jgi:serine/threonine protein kinase/tetratricopeptide (TPR) repeat protein